MLPVCVSPPPPQPVSVAAPSSQRAAVPLLRFCPSRSVLHLPPPRLGVPPALCPWLGLLGTVGLGLPALYFPPVVACPEASAGGLAAVLARVPAPHPSPLCCTTPAQPGGNQAVGRVPRQPAQARRGHCSRARGARAGGGRPAAGLGRGGAGEAAPYTCTAALSCCFCPCCSVARSAVAGVVVVVVVVVASKELWLKLLWCLWWWQGVVVLLSLLPLWG
jgi:hypothetical protein